MLPGVDGNFGGFKECRIKSALPSLVGAECYIKAKLILNNITTAKDLNIRKLP